MSTKKTKAATKGAKLIVEENISTLNFYRNMVFGAAGIYLTCTLVFFQFTALTITLTILSGMVYVAAYRFMIYMARASYAENGQLLDSGVDLNMEGGLAEYVKDLIILTSGTQVLSLISNYFWLLWLLAPLQGFWILWKQVLAPWFFAAPEEQANEVNEKKQRKLEKKMARRH